MKKPKIKEIKNDTGRSDSDYITADNTLKLSGTAKAGAKIIIYDDGVKIGTVKANKNGEWTFKTGKLDDGDHKFKVKAKKNGASKKSEKKTVTIDTDVDVPVVEGFSTDTGVLGDGITEDTDLTLSGTAEANATVKVFDGQTLLGKTVADASGNWTFATGTLSLGAHSFTFKAKDVAGNKSPASAALQVSIVDVTAPAAPSTPDLQATSDTGGSNSDDLTNDDTPTFSGTAEAGSTVWLYADGAQVGSAVATDGTWTITASKLTPGPIKITARAKDAAGNESAVSTPLQMTLDTTPPTAPVIVGYSEDTGTPGDGITADAFLSLNGTAEAGATVGVFDGQTLLGTTAADTNGIWNFAPAGLAEGAHSFKAVATDAAGNASGPSNAFGVILDTTVPAAPVIVDYSEDTGTPDDGITSDASFSLRGTAEAGATVEIFDGEPSIGTTTADTNGIWSFTPAGLAEGAHSFKAVATDAAGNAGGPSNVFGVTLDTTAPPPPSMPDLGATSDTGTSMTDDLTSNDKPTFNGTAEIGSTVKLYADGTEVGSVVATTGAWSITASTLNEGVRNIIATATDAAGNVSADSTALGVTIDTAAPAAPSTPNLAAASDTGTSDADDLTSEDEPTFTGTAEAGSTVTLYADGTAVGSAVAIGGNWTIAASALAEGANTITAKATDAAGNESPPSTALVVILDTTAPAAPVIDDFSDDTGIDGDAITSDTDLTLTGTAEPGSTVELFNGLTSLDTTQADGSGNWSMATGTLTDGAYSLTAKAKDAAGNESPPSTALAVTIDTTAPTDLSIVGTSVVANEAGDEVGDLSATDTGGAPLDYTVIDISSDFEVVGTTLKLKDGVSLDSSANNTAATSVDIQVSDGATIVTKTVTVTVVDTAATSFSAASASFASSSMTLDLNADGFSDLALGGSTVVSMGSATGLQASTAAAVDGTNGFAVNVDADALGGGDLNGDGIDDLAIGSLVDQTVYVVFGSDTAFAATVDAAAKDGTVGFAVTGLALDSGGGAGEINLDVGDVDSDALDDLVINQVYFDGSATVSKTHIVYGDDTGFGATVDVSSALDGTTGFTLVNTADTVTGGSLAVADIDGDDIDDIVLGAPDSGGATGKVYVVKGQQNFAASTDIAALAANEKIVISAAAAVTLGTAVSAIGDVNGDGNDDLIALAEDASAFVLDGLVLQAQATVALNAANTTFVGVSGLLDAGDINGDGIDDLFATDASGNTFALHGRSDIQGLTPAELADAAETDGFVIAGTQAAPIALGDTDGDGFADFMVVNPGTLSLASGADFSGEATFVASPAEEDFGGTPGDDIIIGDQNANILSGGDGDDHILGGAGADTLNGNGDNDRLEGSEGVDTLNGGGGQDLLRGEQGDDILNGGAGIDRLEGGAGNDTMNGDGGNDHLLGGGGDDVLHGGDNDDVLMGDAGDDDLFGDDGEDVLAGGPGLDTLTGGSGADRFIFHKGDGPVSILDFTPGPPGTGDKIDLKAFGPGLTFAALDTNLDGMLTPADDPAGVDDIITDGAGGIILKFGLHDALTITNTPALIAGDLLFS